MSKISFLATRTKGRRGMTLIEILLVLALIGLIIRVAMPKITQLGRANVRTGVRKMSALIKYCYDQSVLTGHLHRVVLDLTKGEQSWALEVATGETLPDEQIKEDLGSSSSSSSAAASDAAKKDTGFAPDEDAGKHRKPNGIRMVDVRSWRLGEGKSLKTGTIAIYCFPNGFVDDVTVSLQEEGRVKAPIWMLKTRSLTGRVDIEVQAVP